LASVEIEGRKLLEACATYLDALCRAADDTDSGDPLARDLADRCRSLLDRRTLAVAEVFELERELKERGILCP
jgi:hypothetical protein